MPSAEPPRPVELAIAMRSKAYQAGVWVGRSGRLGLNPFMVGSMDHEYWKLGHCYGVLHP